MGKANRKLNHGFSDARKRRGKNDCGVCVLMLWKTERSPEAVCLEAEIAFEIVAEE